MIEQFVRAVLTALWAIAPAYLPNSAAVVVGGGRPIDGGRTWRGNRVLGDGKTWRGFLGGTLAGVALALAQNTLRQSLSVALPAFPGVVVLALPLGSMLGDAAGSLCKRRTGRERGARFPVVDQYSSIVGALGLSLALAPAWTLATFSVPVVVTLLVVTPLLHRGTNWIAYRLGLEDEPW